jgi:uncharacterized protein YxeA
MKKQLMIISSIIVSMFVFNGAIYAQTNNIHQTNSSAAPAYQRTEQQDSVIQQSVTISEPDSTKTSENTSVSYRPTEKIHIYSGRHDGNNVIRTVEVPLPDNNNNRSSGVYIPH